LTRQPVGFSLLTGRNDFAGRASHLEIRMFAVAADEQGKGIGKSMLVNAAAGGIFAVNRPQ
ncbi:GNAT family N-acetyltransferase, partial [Cronobacter sakazakii]|uniref:GNAT family N-acetyltransferase n=1 Tax=Cronobacter sakazakii TaxID=28141 RepID=UPI001F4666AD